jgi:hypothetical protein
MASCPPVSVSPRTSGTSTRFPAVVHRYTRDKTGVDLPRLVWSWHPEAPETVAEYLRVWAQALSLEPQPRRDPGIEGFPRITEYAGELAGVRIRVSGFTSTDHDG